MKRKLLYLLSVAFLASCSAPKYSYNFDHYNYNAGKKKSVSTEAQIATEQSPLAIQPNELVASSGSTLFLVEEKSVTAAPVKRTYVQMSKSERKEIRKSVKAEIKNYLKEKKDNVKTVHATKAMEKDLKLAAIFGAVGIVGLIIGGNVFYIIGAIALLIGVIFFVKWLVRQ